MNPGDGQFIAVVYCAVQLECSIWQTEEQRKLHRADSQKFAAEYHAKICIFSAKESDCYREKCVFVNVRTHTKMCVDIVEIVEIICSSSTSSSNGDNNDDNVGGEKREIKPNKQMDKLYKRHAAQTYTLCVNVRYENEAYNLGVCVGWLNVGGC